MKHFVIGLLLAATSTTLVGGARGQKDGENVRALLESDGPFTVLDVARVLQASQKAMAGQSFHAVPLPNAGGPEIDVQMGSAGLPRRLHDVALADGFDDFTGQPARSCRGGVLLGELVIEYTTIHDGVNPVDIPLEDRDGFVDDHHGGRLGVSAHVRDSTDLLANVFEPFAKGRNITLGPMENINGHRAWTCVPQRSRPV